MKLEIKEALHLLLALPAHRSHDEGHRQIGKTALEQLLDYASSSTDENEKAYNKAMVALTLSAVRAFSVERDRIEGVWKSIDAVKIRRERLLKLFESLSPLSSGNYWSKAIVLITSMGVSVGKSWPDPGAVSFGFACWLVVILIGLEIFARITEYGTAVFFDRRGPVEKQQSWQEQSILKYKEILEQYIDEAFEIHKRFYPNKKCMGVNLDNQDDSDRLKTHLITSCLYLSPRKNKEKV
jgi:hypothetical protein